MVKYLCNRSLKTKTKNIKNYSLILAIINHCNWLDDSSPLSSRPSVLEAAHEPHIGQCEFLSIETPLL